VETSTTSSDPAARLIAILETGLAHQHNSNYMQLWAHAFGVDAKDFVAVHRGLDRLRDLLDDVERAINQLPGIKHEQYLKTLPPLRLIISRSNLDQSCGHDLAVLKMIINGLEFASERVQHYAPEPVLPQSELDALRHQADELLEALAKSETVPRNLRLILFDLIKAIQRSIDEYRFKGIRGVRQQLFVIASQIQEHLPEFEKNKDAKEVKGFWHFFKKVDSMTATALHIKELVGYVAPLLAPIVPALLGHK
jgi:hypothetical protein